jgi:predicted unusual protein kinase regulating ubiquinone biosynthesis (AarF/ABC1/UbiB family)
MNRPVQSALGRFLKLGGLMGRVGGSVLGARALDLVLPGEGQSRRRRENQLRNALRIVETLGEMKGAAMKVGQMLSLHESMVSPEVAEVLRSLQGSAPKVPSEVMRYEVEGSLGRPLGEVFSSWEEEAFAAASIGQVHRAVLADGRPVAVKVQYPLIDEIIRADLKNLKRLLGALIGLFSELDFEPIWLEVRDRLLEELDYRHEAASMERAAREHRDVPEIVIPRVIDEASSGRVLTMELVRGLSPEEACSPARPQELRDRWGRVLMEFLLRGLLRHRRLHGDPNLANFAFLDDGRVVVYDFGCVKQVPPRLARGYARVFLTALARDYDALPGVLREMGVHRRNGDELPLELILPWVELFAEILRSEPPYRFGEDPEIYAKLVRLGLTHLSEANDVVFPRDIVFVDRALGGHFGNLGRMGAAGPWRELVRGFAEPAAAS